MNLDNQYLKLAQQYEAGDKSIEKQLQQMVDKMAKKSGYTIGPVYHGSKDHGFHTFETPSYFTSSKDEANAYSFKKDKRDAEKLRSKYIEVTNTINTGKRVPYVGIPSDAEDNTLTYTDNGVIRKLKTGQIEFYTSLTANQKTFSDDYSTVELMPQQRDTTELENFKSGAEEFISQHLEVGENPDVSIVYIKMSNPKHMSILDGNRFGKRLGFYDEGRATASKLKAEGYDGVITDSDAGMYNPDAVGVKHYIPFDPSQIKSSSPVTKDDQGNIIPLSKRFDQQSTDIRENVFYKLYSELT